MTELRHTSISTDAKAASEQNAENARDANQALSERVTGYFVEVSGYAALADTTAIINLPQKRLGAQTATRPRAVLCVNGYATSDVGGSINISTNRGFYYANGSIGVFEPSGLVLNTIYNLTFLVLE